MGIHTLHAEIEPSAKLLEILNITIFSYSQLPLATYKLSDHHITLSQFHHKLLPSETPVLLDMPL